AVRMVAGDPTFRIGRRGRCLDRSGGRSASGVAFGCWESWVSCSSRGGGSTASSSNGYGAVQAPGGRSRTRASRDCLLRFRVGLARRRDGGGTMRHRRILFGLAILLSAGIVLYARSRTRRQQLIRRAGDVREGVSARAVTSPDGEAGPETGETIAASAADVPSTDEPEPVPAAETVAPIPIRRRETPTARAKRVTSESRLPVRQLAGAALIIAAMAWSFGALRGASAAPTTYVNSPVADAFVWATQPSNNYGASKSIRVDGSPLMASYLRFDVPALDGPVTRATLMVYANSRSSAGWDVHAVADSTWGERTITFNNAPPMGSATFASSGAFAGGDWTSADVTSLVTGSGPLSVALTTSGGTQVNLASRESGANAPRLVIETAGSSVAATSTATSSAPPTATSTAVPTTVPPTSTATSVAPPATATATSTSGGGGSATLPLRAAFYYPWFSPAWTQQGIYPYTKYHPALGFYDERDQATVKAHIAAMQYGNISAGIASWWGQGSYTDARVNDLLTAAAGTGFQWAIYYENESQGDPSVSQLTGDLVYIRDHYASNANFLKINGKFVVFVYADAADACGMADRWRQANTVGAYVVLKVFPGYMTCASQPDGWHQYAPAVAADSQGSYSYAISPGFDKVGEATRLARDLTRWQQNVADMAASSAAFQLVTTFNEWGEGTAVESATEWTSPSGYGSYLDALHNSPVTGTTPPTATPPAATATPPPALTPTPTPTVAPPTASPTATSVPPTPTASPTPGGSSTLSFAPVADAYVHSQAPDSNYGTGTSLRVDGSPIVESYLRFDVQGAGSITSATLKVWATSNQSAGYEVHGVADNSWSETGITFNNAPSFDTAGAGSSGPVAASSWTSVDVTSLVSGNGPVSFALLTPSVTALALSSRESGATAPQLVITTDSGAGGGPTPTATATQSGPTPAPESVVMTSCGAVAPDSRLDSASAVTLG
ncbi:MAG: DNRLRE domain-containing protein, partial [Dehalococcoidia bacterium]